MRLGKKQILIKFGNKMPGITQNIRDQVRLKRRRGINRTGKVFWLKGPRGDSQISKRRGLKMPGKMLGTKKNVGRLPLHTNKDAMPLIIFSG